MARPPLASGAKDTFVVPLRHAGTFLWRPPAARRWSGKALAGACAVVQESEPVTLDRDEVVLIEDWRLRPDGSAVAPGADPKDTVGVLYRQRPGLFRAHHAHQ